MRNVNNGRAKNRPETGKSRTKVTLASIAGLVAVAGVGAGVLAGNDAGQPASETAAAQVTPTAADPTPASGATASPQAFRATTPAPTASPAAPKPLSSAERIDKMKGAVASAYRNNTLIQRAPAPRHTAQTVPNDLITEVKTGDIRKDREELRVVSAPGDLTGQKALAWVVDDGKRVGDANCTQKIKLSNNPTARTRPTLLLCWRTSTKRSVYTLLVDLDGKPSTDKSITALNEAWSAMP